MNRDEFLNYQDLQHKALAVPAWDNKEIYIRQLSGVERAEIDQKTRELQKSGEYLDDLRIMAIVCTYTICDEKGERILTDDDVDATMRKNQSALEFISGEAMKYSMMTVDAVEEEVKK